MTPLQTVAVWTLARILMSVALVAVSLVLVWMLLYALIAGKSAAMQSIRHGIVSAIGLLLFVAGALTLGWWAGVTWPVP